MSDGKHLIWEGVIIDKLTAIVDDLYQDYVNLEEFGDNEDSYKLQPFNQLLRELTILLQEHQYEYVSKDQKWFDDHLHLSVKEYWEKMFSMPIPNDEFFQQKTKQDKTT